MILQTQETEHQRRFILHSYKLIKNDRNLNQKICFILCIAFMMTGLSLLGSMAVFAVVTSMMTGVNTLFVSLLPMHFRGEGKVSTATGVLNAITHLGSAAASILFGALTEKFGWGGTEIAWCLCGIAGMFCCMIPIKRWGNNRKNIYTEY